MILQVNGGINYQATPNGSAEKRGLLAEKWQGPMAGVVGGQMTGERCHTVTPPKNEPCCFFFGGDNRI